MAGVPSEVDSDMVFLGARNMKQILVRTVEVSAERAFAAVAPG